MLELALGDTLVGAPYPTFYSTYPRFQMDPLQPSRTD